MHDDHAIHHPHDALFRAALRDPERAAELLRSVLPRDLIAAIEWTSLRRIDASFVDEHLRQQQADDRFAVFQLLRYEVRIWEHFGREVSDTMLLPPILPFVLHHGAHAWKSPRDLRGLIDLDGAPASLVDLQPDLRFLLDDLGACDASALQQRRLTVQLLLPLLHLQQLRREPRTAALLAAWRPLYRRLLATPGGQAIVNELISYVAAVSTDDPERLRSAFARIHKSTEEQFMNTAGRILREGMLQGRQEGLLQGRIDMLLIQLQQRFGDVPELAIARLHGASAEQLDLWARRVLTAPSLDDVLAP